MADMDKRESAGFPAIIAIATFLSVASPALAQISLGTAQSFAVLGGQTVTNTGNTVVTGDVGVSPGTAVTGFTGFPPGGPGIVVGGTIHSADGVAGTAQNDLKTAYDAVAGTACGVDLTGQDLGTLGAPLTPNVYCFSSTAQLTGTLTLNLLGNPNAVFLFKVGTGLNTAVGSKVLLINSGGSTCPPNIFWQVGSSAVIEVGSQFVGNILALTNITLKTGARLDGRALARNAAVNLDTNTIGICAPAIVCGVITVNPASLPNGVVGTAYNQTVSGSGGTGAYTYGLTGTLPTGLVLNPNTGAITGNPTTVGTFNFTITATDGNGCPGSRPYTVDIAAAGCPIITLSPNTLPVGFVGTPYSATITGSGGSAPYGNFTVTGGALPNGLTLSSTGTITGIPTATGFFSFTVRALDSSAGACPGSRLYSIAIGTLPPAGGPTLSLTGMAIMVVLLAAAGIFVMSKVSF